MEQLYTVRICKFNDKEKTEYGYRFIIDENSFQEFIGVKEGNMYINISDGMMYRSLKKNGNYIDQSEEKNIILGQYYVNQIEVFKDPMERTNAKNYLLSLRNLITNINCGKQTKKTK